ncbi:MULTISPECIES: GNAT family N-acetyltransferase [unclassified Nocardia]|uniref:GNAT family N-acetyltransferase n=1 Tax=unclassified Nocardia TaxID=2637762 RepID=UPI001CE445DE|nr:MULTISPECIES: GNAT family N-acetyltransferase [unclassified Nocardia]
MASIENERFGDDSYPYFALRQLFDLHGAHWLVCEVDGRLLGHVLVALTAQRRAWLLSLAVTADSCGNGYGTALVQQALRLCRSMSVRSVFITVRPTNQAALNIYRRAGFRWTAHDDNYFGEGEPRDILECRLDR